MRTGNEILETFMDRYFAWILMGSVVVILFIMVMVIVSAIFEPHNCILDADGLEYCRG